MKISELTSDSWEELREKLKKTEWNGVPIIKAKRMSNGKIVVTEYFLVPIQLFQEGN